MLKNLDPVLSPELLMILRAMGHGDEIAVVDANFPAATNARRLVRFDGLPATRVLDAILSVMPLDPSEFTPEAAWRMQVVGRPDAEQPIFDEFRQSILRHEGAGFTLGSIERYAFYDRVKAAYAVVATGETRLYGNVVLKKGIVRPA